MATRIPIPVPNASQSQALPLGLPAARAPMVTVDQAHRYAFTNLIREAAQVTQDLNEKYEQEQANAWVTKAASDDQLKWTQTSLERQRTAEPGAPNFTPNLLSEYDAYSAQALQVAPPRARAAYQERLARLRTSLGMQAIGFEASSQREHTVSQYRDSFESDARNIALNPGSYDEAHIFGNVALDNSNLPANIKEVLRAQGNALRAGAAASTYTQKDPRGVLKAMQAAAQNQPLPQGFGWIAQLDANAIEQTRTRAQARVDALNNQARIAAAVRERQAATALNAYKIQVQMGVPPRPEDMAKWTAQVAGSEHEATFKRLQQGWGEIQNLAAKPVAEKLTALQAMQAQLQKEGGDAQDVMLLQLAQQGLEANIQMQTADPLQWSARFADIPIEPLDLSMLGTAEGATQIQGILAQREDTIAALQQQNPGVPIAPNLLLQQEAMQLAGAFAAGNANERTQVLHSLVQAAGGSDQRRLQGVLAQLEKTGMPDADVMVRLAEIEASEAQITLYSPWIGADTVQSSRQVVATALHGREILQANGKNPNGLQYKLPKDSEIMAEILDQIGQVYGSPVPGDSGYVDLLKDASIIKDWYVGEAARRGNLSEDLNDDLLNQAIKAVSGEKVDFHGNSTVFAPLGMDESQFLRRANFAVEEGLKANDMWTDNSEVSNFGLVQLGADRYAVTLGGAPTGITIRVDPGDAAIDAMVRQRQGERLQQSLTQFQPMAF